MIVGIIGCGTVGHATARTFTEFCDVRVFDIDITKRSHSLENTLKSDVVFVCLPTPQLKNSGECDLSIISEFFNNLVVPYKTKVFVLRSTVPIGTTRALSQKCFLPNLVHSPEFLTARCAVIDSMVPSRMILGGDSHKAMGEVGLLYRSRFPHVPLHLMSSDESEAVKLMVNGFFAVKVAFWNEMNTLATAYKLDWDVVLTAVLTDGRIHPSHTKVPGPSGEFGFGGACLPKDLNNLIECQESRNLSAKVCRAAHSRNEYIDRVRKS